jgi:hypothetical protein
MRGHVVDHDRVGADLGSVADRDGTEQLRAGADRDVVLNRWMALARGEARATERHALEQGHAVADLDRLADHDAGAVIDEELGSDPGSGMDLDPGRRPRHVRDQARHQGHRSGVQRVADAMAEDRVHARVGEHDLGRADRASGRIAVARGRDVLADLTRHAADCPQTPHACVSCPSGRASRSIASAPRAAPAAALSAAALETG